MAILPNGTSIAISDLADCDRPLSCYLFLRIFARRLEFVHTIVQRRSSSLCTSGLLINEHSILPSVDRPQFVLCKWDIECLRRRAVATVRRAAQCTLARAKGIVDASHGAGMTDAVIGPKRRPGHRTYHQLVVLILLTGLSSVALFIR